MKNLNEYIGKAVSWLTTALVLLVCYDVFMRKVFDSSSTVMAELEWHIFSVIFLLGAGYSLKHDQHVRVDLFYQKFSAKKKAIINILGTVVLLIPWCVMVILTSFRYAKTSFGYLERSVDPGGLPARYVIKFMITLGFILLLYQAIVHLIEQVRILRTKNSNA